MKKILTLLTLSSLVVLAGCSSAELSTNTNETGEANTNAQVVVANTNSDSNTNEVENTNTNSDVESDEVDTSDWLMYTNEEYGFSFKYPSEWQLLEDQSFNNASEVPEDLAILGFNLNNSNIGVKAIYVNALKTNESTLADWFEQSSLYLSSEELSNSKSEFKPNIDSISIQVDGVNGIDQITKGEGGGMREIVILKNNTAFVFTISASSSYPNYRNPDAIEDVNGYLNNFNMLINTIEIE